MSEIPQINCETDYERDLVDSMDARELLFYAALKAVRSDIAKLMAGLQESGMEPAPPPGGLALGSAE
jgi:hypothetical protein